MEIAIVGGGASGFFAAITAKEKYPAARVVIFEKSQTVLAKVKISGGGRCNVTNGCPSLKELLAAYPRGGKALRKGFRIFNNHDAMRWFESRGVPLVIQEDGCVFPRSQDSQSIIDCFLAQTKKLKIGIEVGSSLKAIRRVDDRLEVDFGDHRAVPRLFDKVIVTTGGSPHRKGLEWLEKLQHRIVEPVPSLFTFSMPAEKVTELQGIVVENVLVSISGTKLKAQGPLLITHWGMSGPAILKLSSFGARVLSEKGYVFKVLVNWAHEPNNDAVLGRLQCIVKDQPNKFLANLRPYGLSERLWRYLLEKSALPPERKWGELGKKGLNKLVSVLSNDEYSVHGKGSFKDEFVTCGGVSLESIDCNTMQSKVCPNLYFAGEILDIDGITGGYNFQAAWTTGFIAGQLQ
jgi:predicted Rossmann fold flavoprotein